MAIFRHFLRLSVFIQISIASIMLHGKIKFDLD